MTPEITVLIPTYNNRHQYLKRVLDYFYHDVDISVEIIIADSGKEAFPGAANYPKLKYIHLPGFTYSKKLLHALGLISTPYTVMCADDDFIVPGGIANCIEFLDKNSDYASAQGHLVAFPVPGKIKPIPWMFQINGIDINDDKPTDRILHFFRHHIYLHYSVHRTQNLVDTFSLSSDFSDSFAGGSMEYFLDIICLINGKHKVLPVFYGAQELTETSGRNTVIHLSTLRKMDEYRKEFNLFLEKVAMHIAHHQSIAPGKAHEFISDFFQNNPFFQQKEFIPSYVSYPLSNPRLRFIKKLVDRVNGMNTFKKYYSKKAYHIKHKFSELKKKKLLKKQMLLTKKIPGFPFYNEEAQRDWKIIEQNILRHENN